MTDSSVKREQKGVSCPLENFSRRAQRSSIFRCFFFPSGIFEDRNPVAKVMGKRQKIFLLQYTVFFVWFFLLFFFWFFFWSDHTFSQRLILYSNHFDLTSQVDTAGTKCSTVEETTD